VGLGWESRRTGETSIGNKVGKAHFDDLYGISRKEKKLKTVGETAKKFLVKEGGKKGD